MAQQTFRSAFNGFNREDVVHYIEFINNKHASQVGQLKTEIQALQAELDQLRQADIQERSAVTELEAYRRAERVERVANERVAQLYALANGTLAEATLRADESATLVSQLADSITAQLAQLQTAISNGRNTLQDAAAAMYAIRPVPTESEE